MLLGRSASAGTVDRANVDCPDEGRATRSTGPALRPYQTQAIGAIHDATANQRRVCLAAATESTRNGKAMVTTSAAVNVARSSEEAITEWVGVAAFGGVGEILARHCKEATRTLTKAIFTDRDGNERRSRSLTAEAILPACAAQNEPARSGTANSSPRPRARPSGRALYSALRGGWRVAELPADRVDDLLADGGAP